MERNFSERIGRLAEDRESGATALTAQAAAILVDALSQGVDLESVGKRVLQGQPSMAPLWNLVGHALAARADPSQFARYLQVLERAPRTLVRHAVEVLTLDGADRPLELVTFSYSDTARLVFETLSAQRPVTVACAEGRPAFEGRRMAERLAAARVSVTFFTDAAIAHALEGADAVVIGADAVTPAWFLNKSGTRLLAAAATQQGVPVYVCATRDKFLSTPLAARLTIREERPDEIWPAPPPNVSVHNRYFEPTSLDLVTAVISDLGVLGAGVVPDACLSPHDDLLSSLGGP